MIRTQKWIPDTCANYSTGDCCEFIEQWDDSVAEISRTHEFVTANKLCSFHNTGSGAAAFARCYLENRRKNVSFLMAKNIKDISYDQFKWSYDSSGLLTVNLGTTFTNQQKANLQSQADIQFGPNTVKVL